MRKIFGPSASGNKTQSNDVNEGTSGRSTVRSSGGFFSRLRKSHSAHDGSRKLSTNNTAANAQMKVAGINGNLNLTPSRTLPIVRIGGHRSASQNDNYYNCSSHSFDPSCSSERVHGTNGDLDRSLMQTCTDVKYVNTRPKFTAVVEANFQRQCLQAHNYVREIYGSPPLHWSQELADLAKGWAEKLADRCRILYPELQGIGENIHLITADQIVLSWPGGPQSPPAPGFTSTGDHLTTGMELVAMWAAEAANFDFDKPKWTLKSKNFTQMIWRSSVEMGVARYWNTTRDSLAIVAFYRPGGNSNMMGEFSANLPAKADIPENHLQLTTLAALIQALNRHALGDGGFRSGPPPPLPPRIFAYHPNQTKILK